VPVILLGKLAARKIPFKAVRIVAAGLFAVLAVLTLVASSDVANRGRRSREALSV
jgi:putative Ca2+/H+ antiporter (TMEM165/GDT1 family)